MPEIGFSHLERLVLGFFEGNIELFYTILQTNLHTGVMPIDKTQC